MLARTDFTALSGWSDDDAAAALVAFARCDAPFRRKPYRTGQIGIGAEALGALFAKAGAMPRASAADARSFFETHFVPFRVARDDTGKGLVTGYYEPVARASRTRDDRFRHPLLRPPPGLVALDDANRPAHFDPTFEWGLAQESGIVECPDRAAIETGALDTDALAIAWLESAADTFFIHVQGAARLEFADGRATRITFAAKSGHPFTGIGRLLVERGEIPAASISMQAIRAWLAAYPEAATALMRENRSYIFFRETDAGGDGPVAAAKAPLTSGRSIAVDRRLHTFGTPVHVACTRDLDASGHPFCRLMIAQDTGSAIRGAARGDLFMGTGDAAGEIAGRIKAEAEFHILVPAAIADRFGAARDEP